MNPAAAAAYSQRWDDALDLLKDSAASGDELARGQLEVLAGRAPKDLLDPPPLERISERASVFVCKAFAPMGFSDWFIGRALGSLVRSRVNTPQGHGLPDPMRTALVFELNAARCDVLTAIMQERSARLVKVPLAGQEPANIISYEPGQKFDYHCDFVDPNVEQFRPELQAFGQRVTTIVTYLNTDFEGAHTDFPLLSIAFRGDVGDAVAFSNVRADGSPDRLTLHAGLPPTSGRKWVLSQWARSKPLRWRSA